jgi:hypothetical protein
VRPPAPCKPEQRLQEVGGLSSFRAVSLAEVAVPCDSVVTTKVEAGIKEELRALARAADRSIAGEARKALREYVQRQRGEPTARGL